MKKIFLILMIGLLLVGFLLIGAMGYFWDQNYNSGKQPIDFSHNLHISKVGMECTQCHRGVSESRKAGIPGTSICMECHESVGIEKEEIKKIIAYADKEESIPWLKIHRMGWHVHFSHQAHIRLKIDCNVCHGDVAMMGVPRVVRSLEMGWCVTCHRSRKGPTDCLICHK